jgi:ABC-type transporter Mla subunit MlaD
MDIGSVVLAPVRIPQRIAQALDDLATLAERARRDPDPVEEARQRVDALIDELGTAVFEIRRLIAGGADLTETAKSVNVTLAQTLAAGQSLEETARSVDATGRTLVDGGAELTDTAKVLHVDTRELIDGGHDLTKVSEDLERHMRTFRAALPRLLEGLDTVEELEDAVETVAETVEPLQQTAERVGRVTRRLSGSA